MDKDTRDTLKKYLRSVDLLIEDVELQKKDVAVDIYFDTADLRDSVLGAEAFFGEAGGFERVKFNQPRSWVQMLFSAGWLGSVRLLPPHQAELLSLITLEFGVDYNHSFKTKAIILRDSVEARLPHEDGNDLIEDARFNAHRARELFKSIEARRQPWPTRIKAWRENAILDLETYTPDYAQIVNAPEFRELENSLKRKRHDRARNNSADAAAIVTLIEAVRAYPQSKRIPLFYVPSKNHWDVLRETGIADKLTYRGTDGRPVSILRDTTYFIARALLMPGNTAPASAGRVHHKELRRFRHQLQTVLTEHPIIDQALLHLKLGEKIISETVTAFLDLCFFTNVWTPYGELYPDAVADAGETAVRLTTEEAQQGIEDALNKVRGRLRANARQFTRVSQLRDRLSTASKRLSDRIRELPRRDYIRAFGLFRFVPNKEVAVRVQGLLNEVCSENEVTKHAALSRILLIYEKSRTAAASPDDIAELSAILWILEFDDLLINVLRRVKREGWLAFLFPASLLRERRLLTIAENTLRTLHDSYLATAEMTPNERLRQTVGIAYLSFHLAIARGFRPTWVDRGKASGPPHAAALIEQAVEFASQASTLAESLDPYLHAYSLNQYLYYSVAEGRATRSELREQSDALNEIPNDSDLWDYRYDDTMARYYYLLACTTSALSHQRELSDSAKQHVDRAFTAATHGDKEVERFRTTLQNFRDEILEKDLLGGMTA